ncbi:amidase family protein [Nocardioides humi]|uniref:Amidase n=1 Tax=Nocardioides humi TaxID=449461 RepID=A0ABN2BWG8_9ACTN|nr:amidase family protein [Nocardioides humi]
MTLTSWDERVWRLRADPLVPGLAGGPLTGSSLAVPDVYDVAGLAMGAGNPDRLAAAKPADDDAPVVAALLAAGASLTGITQIDEFGYALTGANAHYGTPPNLPAPGRISGGSSSGSASAVALGEVSIGLGTDTAGAIRVPASYQGLFGIRTTHGTVTRAGMLPLAPSFDAVGWMTRTPGLLARVGRVLVPGGTTAAGRRWTTVPDLLDLADADVAAAVAAWRPGRMRTIAWPLDELGRWRDALVTLQAWEAWQVHGTWLESRLDTLGPEVRQRFERARAVSVEEAGTAHAVVDAARARIRELVGDRVVVLPATPTVAPALGAGLPERLAATRAPTLALTCIASIGGLPAVTVPLRTADDLPCGACLVAGPGRDHDLLDLVS